MSEIVARVARAIDPDAFDGPSSLPRDLRSMRQDNAYAAAASAIAAMREPTDEMVREGGPYATSLSCWRAMIDAALRPTQQK